MAEVDPSLFIAPDLKVEPAVLAGLLSRSPAMMYQWAQEGKLPRNIKDSTYRECLNHLLTFLLHREGEKLEKAKLKEETLRAKDEAKRSRFSNTFGGEGVEDTMHPLMAAKFRQNIKTEYAREADLWQKIAIKRGEYVSFADKLDLVEGIVISIRDTLLHIGNNHPEIQGRVDEAMAELYQLGVVLCEEADVDAGGYIDAMLAKEVDLERDVEDES